jgi:hypothetical protein
MTTNTIIAKAKRRRDERRDERNDERNDESHHLSAYSGLLAKLQTIFKSGAELLTFKSFVAGFQHALHPCGLI